MRAAFFMVGLLLLSTQVMGAQTLTGISCGTDGLDKVVVGGLIPDTDAEAGTQPVLEAEGTPGKIQLTWSPSSEIDCEAVDISGEGYRIYRHDGNGAWYPIYWHVPPTYNPVYEDHTVAGALHCYKVVVIHGGQEGSESNQACAAAL